MIYIERKANSVTLTDGDYKTAFLVDSKTPAASLRAQAEEHRKRAFYLLQRAVYMEQAADRLD